MSESTPVFASPSSSSSMPSRKWVIGVTALASALVFLGVSYAPTAARPAAAMNLRAASPVGSLAGLTADESSLVTAATSAAQSARTARWIVHKNTWATVATTSVHLDGAPFANMASYSDGVGKSAENATGQLYFYLTPMDSTGKDVAKNPNASVSISMAQLGGCVMDAQDPTCWKVIFSGPLLPVEGATAKAAALDALYSKHEQMSWWPQGHGFEPYVDNSSRSLTLPARVLSRFVLHPTEILLLDFYGGAKHITPDEYFAVKF
ncbi:Aste57867_3205 [Aphanomyces stellatus]|uniref:Aste57867_3205 protein n=1 Tax=Aphanomyces stellatus TaxID=120398 RepID=A0A485K9W6_9STRA|nr:hypothetical protein As57867_003195 [Aphanomyces stellatus]VFT80379.1 Aste57867_3205 [Aphanomyces stellatus]